MPYDLERQAYAPSKPRESRYPPHQHIGVHHHTTHRPEVTDFTQECQPIHETSVRATSSRASSMCPIAFSPSKAVLTA